LYGLYFSYEAYRNKFNWFSYHPLATAIGFITLAGNATLIKKIGGLVNTRLHGFLMLSASAAGALGWYVIYRNKEIAKKPHLTSIHGKLGVAVLLIYFGIGIAGAVALNPDWGFLRTNQNFRKVHKIAGRVATAAAWTVRLI